MSGSYIPVKKPLEWLSGDVKWAPLLATTRRVESGQKEHLWRAAGGASLVWFSSERSVGGHVS
jgi:hypothetical protein